MCIRDRWPWEYQTVYEKYRNVKIDGIEYHGKGRAVSETWIGESIDVYKRQASYHAEA